MSSFGESYKSFIKMVTPILESSLDPIALVDDQVRVIYASPSMRQLIGLQARDLKKGVSLSVYFQLDADKSQVFWKDFFSKMESQRLDEVPASGNGIKMRVQFKAVPLMLNEMKGAVISIRDTSPEIIMQAKYKRLKQMVAEREEVIAELEEKLHSIRTTIRNKVI
jgi:PAS domain S-box-containing protein